MAAAVAALAHGEAAVALLVSVGGGDAVGVQAGEQITPGTRHQRRFTVPSGLDKKLLGDRRRARREHARDRVDTVAHHRACAALIAPSAWAAATSGNSGANGRAADPRRGPVSAAASTRARASPRPTRSSDTNRSAVEVRA